MRPSDGSGGHVDELRGKSRVSTNGVTLGISLSCGREKKKQREERKEVARDKRSKGNTSVRGIGREAGGGMNVGEKLISRRSCRCRRTRY